MRCTYILDRCFADIFLSLADIARFSTKHICCVQVVVSATGFLSSETFGNCSVLLSSAVAAPLREPRSVNLSMLAAGFEGKTEDNEKRLPFLHSCAQDSLYVSINNK